MSLSLPASHCPACDHKLTLRDNIPLFGYALNKGKCRHCQAPISPRYLGLEVLATVWGVLCGLLLKEEPSAVVAWSIFGWYLLVSGWIDANTRWLPNTLTWGLLGAGLVSASLSLAGHAGITLYAAVTSAVIWWIALESLNFLFALVRGVEGLARGDVWLTAAIAAWLGGFATLLVVIASFVCIVAAALALRERQSLPMGPALAICAMAYALANMSGVFPLVLK